MSKKRAVIGAVVATALALWAVLSGDLIDSPPSMSQGAPTSQRFAAFLSEAPGQFRGQFW